MTVVYFDFSITDIFLFDYSFIDIMCLLSTPQIAKIQKF
jgi:hypothetical protein